MLNNGDEAAIGLSAILPSGQHRKVVNASADMITYNKDTKMQFVGVNELGSFFGVKAMQKQQKMRHGRHPQSLPRDSEMWHYSKLATNRRNRIKKGHQFWDVIEEENISRSISQEAGGAAVSRGVENANDEDEFDNFPDTAGSRSVTPPTAAAPPSAGVHAHTSHLGTDHDLSLNFLKSSSINSQLKDFLSGTNTNDLQHLELKVDFKTKNLVYYGMSFILMNYADEILYVNQKDQLRCKSIRLIEPTDRIKFKVIDLFNPSNPKALHFGDPMWLQVVDSADGADTSFATGHVLSSKVFGMPQLNSVQYDKDQVYARSDASGLLSADINKDPLTLKLEAAGLKFKSPRVDGKLYSFHSLEGSRQRRSSRRNSKIGSSVGVDEAASDAGDNFKTPEDVASASVNDDPISDDGGSQSDEQLEHERRSRRYGVAVTAMGGDSSGAAICGDISVTRIVETRKTDITGFEMQLSDERALRYHSKQAALQGRWVVNSAALPERAGAARIRAGTVSGTGTGDSVRARGGAQKSAPPKDASDLGVSSTGTSGGGKSGTAGNSSSGAMGGRGSRSSKGPAEDTKVYSLSPIFIQQDLYCLGTKRCEEHISWPMRSSYIIDSSESISREQAAAYRTAYRDSALVKGASSKFQSQNRGSRVTETLSYDDIHSNPHSGSAVSQNERHDYGCLRKIVRKGFPYDFNIDKRCVWRIALFEQFSDNNVKLSDKDKAAKKVMETATMAMKLSQLNREGARTHIEAGLGHGNEEETLVGGESFARTLREINFKMALKTEQKYLKYRRLKELRLKDHFNHHIQQVLDVEEQFEEERKDALRRSASREGSTLMSPTKASLSAAAISDNLSIASSSITGRTKGRNAKNQKNWSSSISGGGRVRGGFKSRTSGTVAVAVMAEERDTSRIENRISNDIEDVSLLGNDGVSQYSLAAAGMSRSPQRKRSSFVIDSHPDNPHDSFYIAAMEEAARAASCCDEGEVEGASSKNDSFEGSIRERDPRALDPRRLLLTQPNSLQKYDALSDGERVLALHRTFNYIESAADRLVSSRRNSTLRTKIVGQSVQKKIEKLMQEDQLVNRVLDHKERQQKLQSKADIYEHCSGV